MTSQSVKPTFSNKSKQQRANKGADFLDSPDARPSHRGGQRELQKTDWIQGSTVSGTVVGVGLADLEQSGFDQFKDRKSTYHDSLYNTEIDESKLTPAQREAAARLAKEIEAAPTGNAHLAEERGQAVVGVDKDQNEELMYSGVERVEQHRELRNAKTFACRNVELKAGGSFVAGLDKIVSSQVESGSIVKRGILSNQWAEIRARYAARAAPPNQQVQ